MFVTLIVLGAILNILGIVFRNGIFYIAGALFMIVAIVAWHYVPIVHEYKYECDNGFTTGWVPYINRANGSIFYNEGTSYKIPDGTICKREKREITNDSGVSN